MSNDKKSRRIWGREWTCEFFVTFSQSSTSCTFKISGIMIFMSGFFVPSSCIRVYQYRHEARRHRCRTSSRPRFVPRAPSFRPAVDIRPEATVADFCAFDDEAALAFACFVWALSLFCKAMPSSLNLIRRLLSTHSSQLFIHSYRRTKPTSPRLQAENRANINNFSIKGVAPLLTK